VLNLRKFRHFVNERRRPDYGTQKAKNRFFRRFKEFQTLIRAIFEDAIAVKRALGEMKNREIWDKKIEFGYKAFPKFTEFPKVI